MNITSPLASHRHGRLDWRLVSLFTCSALIAAMAIVGVIQTAKAIFG
jgi:hypothetical protein